MSGCLSVFLSALGMRHPSKEILDAIVQIGDGFVESQSSTPGDTYLEFFTRGVAFVFSNEQLVQITIYCKARGGYSSYPFLVFSEIANNATKTDVRTSLGAAQLEGGGEYSILLGHINPWWKYIREKYSITFEFDIDAEITALHLILESAKVVVPESPRQHD